MYSKAVKKLVGACSVHPKYIHARLKIEMNDEQAHNCLKASYLILRQ